MLNLLSLGTKQLSFQGPDTISYVWKVTILKMGRNKGIFFPFSLLASQFCICEM